MSVPEISLDEKLREHQRIVIAMRTEGPSQIARFVEGETTLIKNRLKNMVYKSREKPEIKMCRMSYIQETLLDVKTAPDCVQKQLDSSARCDKILQCLEMMKK